MAISSRADIAERVLRARIQLALDQPFLASAVLHLPMRECAGVSWCRTMATDGYHIFYNPDWTGGLSTAELRGVIAHEVLHVVFAHSERRGEREPVRWNWAADFAVNLLLVEQGFELPAGGALDRRFVGLPSEEIYFRLLTDAARGVEAAGGVGATGSGCSERSGILVDPGADLLSPEDPRLVSVRSSDMPDRQQRVELVASLRASVAKHLEGRAATHLRQDLVAAARSQVDWKALFRQWLLDRIKHDWSAPPFSKRHIHRGIYLPSSSVQAPGHVVFAIDTSGSISQAQLSAILAEVRAYRETFPCRLTVIQADASVQSVFSFPELDDVEAPRQMTILGRGGTDFRPVFEWVRAKAQDEVTALIYATDGYGTFPAQGPAWPTIWLVMPGGLASEKFPFGVCVRLR